MVHEYTQVTLFDFITLVISIAQDEPTFEWKLIFPFHDLFIVCPHLTDAFTYIRRTSMHYDRSTKRTVLATEMCKLRNGRIPYGEWKGIEDIVMITAVVTLHIWVQPNS